MADQTAIIAGLAGGLGGGIIVIIGLSVCIHYQYKRWKEKSREAESSIFTDRVEVVSSQNTSQTTTQQSSTDFNPETNQPLPEASGLQAAQTPQQPVISPIFLKPSLAFDSSAGLPNPFMNRFYGEIPNQSIAPQIGPGPYGPWRMNVQKSTRWLAPVDQFNVYRGDAAMDPGQSAAENVIQKRNNVPLGASATDVEQAEEQNEKKDKKSKDIQIVVKKDKKKKKRRSRRRRDSSSSDSSSSSSSSGGSSSSSEESSSDSDSSTKSVNRLRIIKPGMDSVYMIEDGNKGKKNKKKSKQKHRIIAMIPHEPPPAPAPAPAPAPPVQAPPPPAPVNPPAVPPQPMVFILPAGTHHHHAEPPRAPEFEVRPVAVPPQNLAGASAFWSADGQARGDARSAYFRAGGGMGGTQFETQERSAQIGHDDDDYSGFAIGRHQSGGAGCMSCEVRSSGSGGGGVGGYAGYGGGGGGGNASGTTIYGAAASGANAQQTTRGQGGLEETTYTINF